MSPNRQKHAAAYRKVGQALTLLEREWRIALGQSPNPWGVDKSAGFDVQQIITRHKLSKLERRTLFLENPPDEEK